MGLTQGSSFLATLGWMIESFQDSQALAERHGFQTKPVAMKNTHPAEMNELLIGRNLDWVEDGGVFRETPNKPQLEVRKTQSKSKKVVYKIPRRKKD